MFGVHPADLGVEVRGGGVATVALDVQQDHAHRVHLAQGHIVASASGATFRHIGKNCKAPSLRSENW
jgi:hypothetical protein